MAKLNTMDRLRRVGPVFRSRDALGAGVSWRDLYRLRDNGELVELSRGLYQLAEASGTENIDFVSVCARAPQGMICLNSALAHWDLSDEIPSQVHLAVPYGTHRPAIDYPPTKVHVFSAATFDVGRIEIRMGGGESIQITDRERTVVDAFRLRHLIGESLAHDALRRYLGSKPRLSRISDVAHSLRAWKTFDATLRLISG